MHLYRGIFPIHYSDAAKKDWRDDMDARINCALDMAWDRNIVKPGSSIVIVTGWKAGSGSTNTVRVITVSERSKSRIKILVQESVAGVDDPEDA